MLIFLSLTRKILVLLLIANALRHEVLRKDRWLIIMHRRIECSNARLYEKVKPYLSSILDYTKE